MTGIPTSFVHTLEFAGTSGCGDGDSPCFPVSAAVRDAFLPHREAVMAQFLNNGPCCDAYTITPISPAEPIAMDATELADIDVAALLDAEALQESLASPVTVSAASTRRSHEGHRRLEVGGRRSEVGVLAGSAFGPPHEDTML